MRLDEWQKWLDAQFVDPSSTDAHERVSRDGVEQADPSHVLAVDVQTPVQAGGENLAQTDNVVRPTALPEPDTTALPMGVRYARPKPAHAVAPVSAPPPADARPKVPMPPTGSDRPSGGVIVDAVEVPSLERYFPFLRSRMAPDPADDAQVAQPEDVGEVREPVASAETPDEPHEILRDCAAVDGDPNEVALDEQPSVPDVTIEPEQHPETVGEVPVAVEPTLDFGSGVLEPSPARTPEDEQIELCTANLVEPATAPPAVDRPTLRDVHPRRQRPAEAARDVTAQELWSLTPRRMHALLAADMAAAGYGASALEAAETRLSFIQHVVDPTFSLGLAAGIGAGGVYRVSAVPPGSGMRCMSDLQHDAPQGLTDALHFMEENSVPEPRQQAR